MIDPYDGAIKITYTFGEYLKIQGTPYNEKNFFKCDTKLCIHKQYGSFLFFLFLKKAIYALKKTRR